MITIHAGRNRDGVTFALPPQERQRWERGAPRLFVALEPSEEGSRLGDVLNVTQAYAAAALLTGGGGAKESLLFLDPVTGEQVLAIDRL